MCEEERLRGVGGEETTTLVARLADCWGYVGSVLSEVYSSVGIFSVKLLSEGIPAE